MLVSRRLRDSLPDRLITVSDDDGDLSSEIDEIEIASTFIDAGLSTLKHKLDSFSQDDIRISGLNPATGLPMNDGTDLDIAGNFYGDDGPDLSQECDAFGAFDDWCGIDSDND